MGTLSKGSSAPLKLIPCRLPWVTLPLAYARENYGLVTKYDVLSRAP